jgi:hypothetical protein
MNYFLFAVASIIVVTLGILIIRRNIRSLAPPDPASQKLDDQRFAGLLITEIRLYNQRAVEEGRENSDLYHRLKGEIDRAREMYDERVGARAGVHPDYFHEALVNDLAGGDVSNLGTDYLHD